MDFDLLIVGAGPGGIFSAYEAMKLNPELKIAYSKQETRWRKENVRLTG